MWFFYFNTHPRVFFIAAKGNQMQMTIVNNPDTSGRLALAHKIARVVYAQTNAVSLPLVQAFTSMIQNLSNKTGQQIGTIIADSEMFPALQETDINHSRLYEPAESRGFQMCLRTALRMMSGLLPDCCYGATKYHYSDTIPDWATSRGYIADIDGILFYT